MIKLHEAILELMPTAEVTVRNESEIIWGANCLDNHPTEEQIKTKQAELQTEWNAQDYARNRKDEYPSIGDQLDALYHAGVFPADMTAKLKKVKDDNPKG